MHTESPNHPDRDIAVEVEKKDGDLIVEVEVGAETILIDIVDVEEYGRENRCPPAAHHYKIKVDGKHYVFEKRFVTGREILEKAGKTPPERYELEKRKHGGHYVAIPLTETVDLGEHGIEVFETFPLDETEG